MFTPFAILTSREEAAGPSAILPPYTTNLGIYVNTYDTQSYPGTGTTWTDTSGNGNDYTLTNQSLYNDGTYDYFLFGEFAGTKRYAAITGLSGLPTGMSGFDSEGTSFIVIKKHPSYSFGGFGGAYSINDGGTGNIDYLNFIRITPNTSHYQAGSLRTQNGNENDGNIHILTSRWSRSADWVVGFDNSFTSAGSAPNTYSGTVGTMAIGYNANFSDDPLNGLISEVITYTERLGTTDFEDVYNYLANRYGLPTI